MSVNAGATNEPSCGEIGTGAIGRQKLSVAEVSFDEIGTPQIGTREGSPSEDGAALAPESLPRPVASRGRNHLLPLDPIIPIPWSAGPGADGTIDPAFSL